MKKICTYGLPRGECEPLASIVDKARKMDEDALKQLDNAASAIEFVRYLKSLPDGHCTA